jgi:septum site-determining protein MinC
MTLEATGQQQADRAFDLRASGFTLPVLQLLDTDMDVVARQFSERVRQAPDFFKNAPVVIDLQCVREAGNQVDFALLVGMLRGYGMIPVGVRGGAPEHNEMAGAFELAVLADARDSVRIATPRKPVEAPPPKPAVEPEPEPKTAPAPPPAEAAPAVASVAKIVTRPVRSGQRIYVKDSDLVVLSSVSAGAELIAGGNIHVYGVLRGRALAGVNGNTEARIFCQGLGAELVSIAGTYRVSEDIEDSVRSLPVQVYLDGKRLRIYPL